MLGLGRRAGVLLLGASSLLACARDPDHAGRLAARQAAVINGTADPTETGTVLITHWDHPFLCSGTLIGATLVVTAKHCAMRELEDRADEPLAGDRFRVGFGSQQSQLVFRGSTRMEWIGMPGELEVQPAVDAGEDVALLWLSSAAPIGSRIHDVKLDYAPVTGDPITIVGYGVSSLLGGGSGVKLATTDSLGLWDPATGILQTEGKGACSGDSGGSFLFGSTRDLVGVTSTAGGSSDTSHCDVGLTQASSVRNPRVAKLISDALGSIGVCSPQVEVCGNGQDEDCDGIADNQCKKIGEACASEVDCASGACVELAVGRVCARTCGERQPCPSGSRCVQSCDGGYCVPGSAGVGMLLDVCSSDADCSTDYCSLGGCTTRCNPLLGQCSDDMACSVSSSSGTCGECAPLEAAAGPRRLGEACAVGADCVEGACRDDGFGVLRCAAPCLQGNVCPAGFVCDEGQCVRGGEALLGERCPSADACASGVCAVFPSEPWMNYCTRTCAADVDCGAGYACREELSARHCVPIGIRMGQACANHDECLTARCEPSLGVCTRACSPTTLPCPPGFACRMLGADLACLPGPNAWPSTAEPSPEAAASDAQAAGAAGASATPAPHAAEGGCGCRTASPLPQNRASALALGLAFLALACRRRRARGRLQLCASMIVVLAGCSSTKAGPADSAGSQGGAAGDAGADSRPADPHLEGALDGSACVPPTPESTCDTFPQCGCKVGEKCDVVDLATGLAQCAEDGDILAHQFCSSIYDKNCVAGSTCLGGVCRTFCAAPEDCPGERRECAEIEPEIDGGRIAIPGLRVCTAACDPIDPLGTCGPGLNCFFTSASGPGTDCFLAGGGVGQNACDNDVQCAQGYLCVSNAASADCLKTCRIGNPNDCPAGTTCGSLVGEPTILGVQYGACM